ncbi:uncharacterized protein CTRU02_207455 [Colletotrichum truncatum]|uniref:Uncharacterized protein n=1 Tax=Colletotrichum truncatum TaxID=5467 RepID=A0ACC3Z0X2_COLTU|nr:uncharacterized protein CTRU02_00911 [Colletotrichum truncatum]KAF6800506.1 hypothetical protein CTRU02_00911 [Colletotrichum truncatum]
MIWARFHEKQLYFNFSFLCSQSLFKYSKITRQLQIPRRHVLLLWFPVI